MMLAPPPRGYDPNYIVKVNQAIQQEDLRNRKTGTDIELGPGEKLILRSPNGTRWQVFVGDDGFMSGGPLGGAAAFDLAAAWTPYTPTVASATGAIGSYAVGSARYKRVGNIVFVAVDITITAAGTGSGRLRVSLPVPTNGAHALAMTDSGLTDRGGYGLTNPGGSNPSLMNVCFSDGSYPGATNARLIVTGQYEVT